MEIDNSSFFKCVLSYIDTGQSVEIKTKGNSMNPLLVSERDTIVLSPINMDDIKKYDVVLFQYGSSYILHRLISIKDGIYTFKGDGNLHKIEQCHKENILAIASSFIRKGKRINTDSNIWKIYTFLWVHLPFKRIFLAIWRRILNKI